jgi:hypothetical protein
MHDEATRVGALRETVRRRTRETFRTYATLGRRT